MRINEWHKAVASNGGTNCVEVMETADGFLVRDTKDDGTGPVLSFTHGEWAAFLAGVNNGEFDPVDTPAV
ncbi:MAG TPA: DUF397 domain-containing protein [Actinospica sp.]|jgi:hypothetical protein|nr:DUF397 domain-containing protein [Actinospica sp.]